MEYDSVAGEIKIDKALNELDKFAIDFVKLLDGKYVVVSGYVSILLGRSRASEDIDLLIPKLEKNEFIEIFRKICDNGFECLNTSDAEEAFDLWHNHAIRFARIGRPVPNMEFKMISNNIHNDAFDNRLLVRMGGDSLYISPMELQIAYKLSLMAKGNPEELHSDKDFEDAKHLYEIFKEDIDKEKLINYVRLFDVEDKWEFLQDEG